MYLRDLNFPGVIAKQIYIFYVWVLHSPLYQMIEQTESWPERFFNGILLANGSLGSCSEWYTMNSWNSSSSTDAEIFLTHIFCLVCFLCVCVCTSTRVHTPVHTHTR